MLITLRKRVSRFENRMDAAMERFMFHHRFLGFFMVFIDKYSSQIYRK